MAAHVLGHERSARWDTTPVAFAVAHAAVLLAWPSIPVVAFGLWWNANTISHHFIHRPFFRTRTLNAGFSCFLSLLLGFPQSLWRSRHLAHHLAIEGRRERRDLKPASVDLGAVIALWGALLFLAPRFVLTVYLPGFLLGLGLCYLQGHYEHAAGTVSHYGRLYNFLLFNDGYHVEHHARPAAHWRELPAYRAAHANGSRWPAVLRWLELVNLCALERLVLRSPALQRLVLERHERAFRTLLRALPAVSSVGIVGGGLFPRTALILRRLYPEARVVLIDHSESNLAIAREFLWERKSWERRPRELGPWERRHPCLLGGASVLAEEKSRQGCLRSQGLRSQGSEEFLNERFEPGMQCAFDLVVIPLAFEGDRRALYATPPAAAMIVHDWLWRRQGVSAVVSWLLLKRLNLVIR
jgi:hypothetical protein